MTVLLVGADRLGNMPKELGEYGCEKIIHWDGRKVLNKNIPTHVDMVLVIHDYINHVLMNNVKEQAKRRRLPIIFSKRGTAGLKNALKKARHNT